MKRFVYIFILITLNAKLFAWWETLPDTISMNKTTIYAFDNKTFYLSCSGGLFSSRDNRDHLASQIQRIKSRLAK
ncbi:MAG: hypothetical protein NT007_10110 [Candidatus Kapabacteria bacterium]|nr:hypothetical protein [Candidatus Kapabacteria bacterium]